MMEKVIDGAASKNARDDNGQNQEEARNPTSKRSDEGAGQKMELAGTRPGACQSNAWYVKSC